MQNQSENIKAWHPKHNPQPIPSAIVPNKRNTQEATRRLRSQASQPHLGALEKGVRDDHRTPVAILGICRPLVAHALHRLHVPAVTAPEASQRQGENDAISLVVTLSRQLNATLFLPRQMVEYRHFVTPTPSAPPLFPGSGCARPRALT